MTLSNSSIHSNKATDESDIPDPRIKKFEVLLDKENLNIEQLRKISWNGVPVQFRGIVWKIMLEHLPVIKSRREQAAQRKRDEYKELCLRYYDNFQTNEFCRDWYATASSQEKAIIHQIKIDVPRTLPYHSLFSTNSVQRALERILLMWAFRHPASGYVQGINDLITPFFVVFLEEIIYNRKNDFLSEEEQSDISVILEDPDLDEELDDCLPKRSRKRKEKFLIEFTDITPEEQLAVEADVYWCASKFIDCIQDNFTVSQPGILRMVSNLEELVGRIDAPLLNHLRGVEAHFYQFSFRWMNCLLMRELPLNIVIRIWDTYISEGDLFPSFHTYVCASLLITFSAEIRQKDFQEAMIFLQNLPTNDWTVEIIEPLLSQAFVWQTYYKDSPSHLKLNM